jgi:hypothetical protein
VVKHFLPGLSSGVAAQNRVLVIFITPEILSWKTLGFKFYMFDIKTYVYRLVFSRRRALVLPFRVADHCMRVDGSALWCLCRSTDLPVMSLSFFRIML